MCVDYFNWLTANGLVNCVVEEVLFIENLFDRRVVVFIEKLFDLRAV
jgi:hypothetical protein